MQIYINLLFNFVKPPFPFLTYSTYKIKVSSDKSKMFLSCLMRKQLTTIALILIIIWLPVKP